MSTVLPVQAADQNEVEDPFRYGWRYVRRELSDGRSEWDQVPLRYEDLLHPEEGDHVTHSDAHQRRCDYLYDVFRSRVAQLDTAIVLQDVRIAWDTPDLQPHGPDLMVIFGVRERRNWSTFDVTTEGVRPALIVEITSPETRGNDRVTKLDEYEQAGVPLYIIVDGVERRGMPPLRLLGHELTLDGYRAVAPDERGRLWLAPVRVWLGVERDELVCYDEHDQPLGDYVALAEALSAEVAARLTAETRAVDAETRAVDAETRAVDAETRAAEELRAREAAEAQVRALEAELRRLRGTG